MTTIEAIILIAIVGILVGIILGLSGGRELSFGVNGIAETRCINGYQFIIGQSGSAQQVLGNNGGGVPCN